jgi:hypothetical protein
MGTRWPKSGSYEFDNNGERAPGALVYFFAAGTSTPYPVYQDADESTPHEHPVEADGNGRWPAIFIPFGDYKEITTTAGGTTLFSVDDVPNPAPFTDDFEVDETAQLNTGDFWGSLKNGTRTGAVRLNGRTIGNAASGATERANADTEDLFTFIYDNLANGQAAVSGGRGASAAADYAANKTIALPDWRGTGPRGFADMGNTASTNLDAAPVVTGSTILPGSILGANTHVLLTAESPAHTHGAGSFAADSNGAHTHTGTTDSGGAHTHTVDIASGQGSHTHTTGSGTSTLMKFVGATGDFGTSAGSNLASGAAIENATLPAMTGTANSNGSHTHTFTTGSNGAHTHTISGTSGSTGGDGAHNNVARDGLCTWFIKL